MSLFIDENRDRIKRKFFGKTLLVLGSNTMAEEVVEYAKKNGAYTIVTDYLPFDNSSAKKKADEYWNISTADINQLVVACRKKNINGVFAGISEFNILQAEKLSRVLGLRFYFTRRQWDSVEVKDNFKELCFAHGVRTPDVFFSGSESEYISLNKGCLSFPLVVKPVDGSASIGVSICRKLTEVDDAVSKAFAVSFSKRIIIEQYIVGYEFTAHYTICNGKVALACVDNRYSIALHKGDVTTIPIARVYPSLFQELYERDINNQVISLFECLRLENALVFVQGFFKEDTQEFFIIEAGLRSAAEAPCRFIEYFTGQNHFFMLVDYILLGKTNYDLSKEKPGLEGKCCAIISFASKGGIIGSIEGLEEILRDCPQIKQYENRYPVGSEVPPGDTLKQLVLRFIVICNNREELSHIIDLINNSVKVRDNDGRSLVCKMESQRVFGLV